MALPYYLKINGRTGVEGFAQGGIYKECLSITGMEDKADPMPDVVWPIPVGTIIYVAPALWDENYQAKWQLGNAPDFEPVWSFSYIHVAGIYSMNLINIDPKYKNMICRIRIFNSSVFLIELEYVALADTHNFLYPYTYQPLQLWTKQSVDGKKLNVYNTGNRVIGMRVSIDDETWVQNDKFVQGNPWKFVNYPSVDNKYFLEVNGQTTNGFILGEDLKVNLRNFPQYTNSQYYAGIFRIDELLGTSMEFYDEIFLQYAKANNTADEPFQYATNTFKRDQLKDFHGFRFDTFESIADFTIDADYFVSGGRYRCFLIAIENCEYRSYLFDEFGEDTTFDSPTGDIDIHAITIDGTTVVTANGTCLYDVPSCSVMRYEMQMDIASYEADLLAKGLTGVWADYFKEVYCFVSDGVNQLGFNPFINSVIYTEAGGQAIIQWDFKIPEDWEGENKFLNFVWVFEYGPNISHIVAYTSLQVHVSDQTDIELKGAALPLEICVEDAAELNICFENPSAGHQFELDLLKDGVETTQELISNKEPNFSTALDACLDFDFTEADPDTEYCLKMRAHDQTTTGGGAPCTDMEISFERTEFAGEIWINLCYDIPAWVDADIAEVILSIKDPSEILLQSFDTKADCKLFQENYFDTKSPFTLGVYIRRTDGFTYYLEIENVTVNPAGTSFTFDICTPPTFHYCDENPILSHTIVWNFAGTGSLPNKTVTPVFTNPGLPSSQVKQYRQNGGAWVNYTVPLTIPPSWKVEFRWQLTYADCYIELYDCLTEEQCALP